MKFGTKKGCLLGFAGGVFFTVAVIIGGIAWLINGDLPAIVNMARLLAAHYFVQSYFVNEIDDNKLTDGAIAGMVNALGDQHSRYLDKKMYQDLKNHTEASFGGIGIVMGFRDKKVTVMSVMEGTPGEAAGLKTGDEILAVDGTNVRDYQPDEVALHIRGEIGTKVVLTVAREGAEPTDYTIERANIHVKTAAGKLLDDKIGYIRISSFADKTAEEFAASYKELEEQGMKALVIDVRENPGGLVTSCVEIAEKVVPEGNIVSVLHRDGTKEEYLSKLKEQKYPIAVLINGNSASASEILSGALQDTGAAVLVGTKSYGKGSVQAVFPLGSGDAMKLTVAKYYTPSGRSIDGTGIEPDVKVELLEGTLADLQLEKAIELLREKIK